MITKDTAVRIALAYEQIERGEKLLEDVRKAEKARTDRGAFAGSADTDLRDVFGRRHREMQLGIPSGSNAHSLVGLSYDLAIPIIEAHIADNRSALQALCRLAKREIEHGVQGLKLGLEEASVAERIDATDGVA